MSLGYWSVVNYTLIHCTLILYLSGNKWDTIYSGAAREHLCDRLNPGCSYRLRVYCIGEGGQSMVILADVFFNTNLWENVIQQFINTVRGIIVQKCLTKALSESPRNPSTGAEWFKFLPTSLRNTYRYSLLMVYFALCDFTCLQKKYYVFPCATLVNWKWLFPSPNPRHQTKFNAFRVISVVLWAAELGYRKFFHIEVSCKDSPAHSHLVLRINWDFFSADAAVVLLFLPYRGRRKAVYFPVTYPQVTYGDFPWRFSICQPPSFFE